jgi:hypothetical protein
MKDQLQVKATPLPSENESAGLGNEKLRPQLPNY